MPLPILTALAQAQCPHQAKVTFVATSSKVLIEKGLVFVQGDQATIVPCAFTVPSGKPQPCVKGIVVTAATKVLVEAKPAIVRSPSDLAQSAEQIAQGPLVYSSVQTKVIAT
jgi:uncharacterized Zn-binding protein involved in type VI secretion